MAFNSYTYRANRYRKEAWAHLAEARDIKARATVGDAYDWEIGRIAHLVFVARISMRLSLQVRQLRTIQQQRQSLA